MQKSLWDFIALVNIISLTCGLGKRLVMSRKNKIYVLEKSVYFKNCKNIIALTQ